MKNKNILITGGGGRIGSAIAYECLSQGAMVIIADNNENAIEKAITTMPNNSKERITTIVEDCCSSKGIDEVIKTIKKRKIKLNSCVHSAYPRSEKWGCKFEKLEEIALKEDLTSQLGSAILISQKIITNFFIEDGGSMLHISSIQGVCAPKFEHYANTEMSSPIEYAAIKAGVISITKWLAKYYKGKNIRVNCISPGGIKDKQPDSFVEKYMSSCNLIGLLDAKDIAKTAALLLSDDARAITGQNFIIDDGWTL